ncbi:MAG: hypothetical protein WCR98_06810 [Saccharofermentanales bacterium]|nr:hypothetical protein [Sphaerochaetaceae bacterium]
MEDKNLIKDELMKSAEAEDIMKLAFIMHGYEKEKKEIVDEHEKGETK